MTASWHTRLRHPPHRLVNEPEWPDAPMPTASVRHWRDVPLRRAERAVARLLGRNPPAPPWRRRAGRAWQSTLMVRPGRGGHAARPLLGVVAAWNEDDIIWSTVTHLLAEGCAEVFVLDDSSTDATAGEARAAGAQVVPRESTARWWEAERCAAVNALIAEETRRRRQEVWWLVADADEFPTSPGSVRHFLDDLPETVDVVGSAVVEHYPVSGSTWSTRSDPLRRRGFVCPYPSDYCPQGHWKHQLFLQRTPDDLAVMPGAHTLRAKDGRRVREWREPVAMHHFPFRDLDRLERRLRGVEDGTGRYGTAVDSFTRWRARHRLRVVQQLRAGDLHRLSNTFPGQRRDRLPLQEWNGRTGDATDHPS